MHQADFLLQLALLWGAAKLAAELAERLGQPPVLGELLAGIVLGASFLGWVPVNEPTLVRLGEQSGGRVGPDDFIALPCSHPDCSSITYFIKGDEGDCR